MADRVPQIRDALMRNWTLKLTAVLLGTLSFYTIRGAIRFEVPYNLPVVVNVEPGVAVLDQSARSAEVTFRGSQEDLRYLNQRNIRVVVRPKVGETSASETVAIDPASVEGAPRRVRVVAIRPSEVTVSFDHEAEKLVAVSRPRTLGRPLAGQLAVDYEPKTVRIRGPLRRLEAIASVATEPLDVEGKVESFSARLRVLPPPDTWISLIEPAEVVASVTISSNTQKREFTNVAVVAMIPPDFAGKVRVEPAAVRVDVQGQADAVASLTADALMVFVRLADPASAGERELPVLVHLPEGMEAVARAAPRAVKVRWP